MTGEMTRRDFLKTGGKGLIAASIVPYVFASNGENWQDRLRSGLLEQELYDPDAFQAAERFMPLGKDIGMVNVLPRDVGLDVRIAYSDGVGGEKRSAAYPAQGGEPVNIPIDWSDGSRKLDFRVEYRKGNGTWKPSGRYRKAKTPNMLDGERDIKVIMFGDDHSFDDRDGLFKEIMDPELREMRLTGDYVNLFLTELLKNPGYEPDGELAKLMYGYCLASMQSQIIRNEDPDLIVNLGDHRGGAAHTWPGLGLKEKRLATDQDLYEYAKTFRIGTRKMLSGISHIPVYWALGNHEGENGFDPSLRAPNVHYRMKFLPMSDSAISTDAGRVAPEENYLVAGWGRHPSLGRDIFGGSDNYNVLSLFVLDSTGHVQTQPGKVSDWTLGEEQKEWFINHLRGIESRFRLVAMHHVMGGWPCESNPEEWKNPGYVYGRGPMFTREDYNNLAEHMGLSQGFMGNLDDIEQPVLTETLSMVSDKSCLNGGNGQSGSSEMVAVCVGSPNHNLYRGWTENEKFWRNKIIGYGDSGGYGLEATGKSDYYGPPGYVRITLHKEWGMTLEYMKSAHHHNTNLDPSLRTGEVIYRAEIDGNSGIFYGHDHILNLRILPL